MKNYIKLVLEAMSDKSALVIIHSDSLDSYGWQFGYDKADSVANSIMAKLGSYDLVILVHQGLETDYTEQIERRLPSNSDVVEFDEDVESWDVFEQELVDILRNDGIGKVWLAGAWYNSQCDSGCVTYTRSFLTKHGFDVEVDPAMVAHE